MDDYVKVRRAQGFDNDNARRIRDAIHQWVHRGYVAKVEGADTDSPIFRKVKFLKG